MKKKTNLWLACTTRCVKNEQIILGIHRLRCTKWPLVGNQKIHADIFLFHFVRGRRFCTTVEAFPHHDVLDDGIAVQFGQSVVDDILETDGLATSTTNISCNQMF